MGRKVKEKIKFVGLHNHTAYSIWDAIGYPKDYLESAYANGLKAHAFTDHGNMNNLVGAMLHQRKMKEQGKEIRVIYGIEAYFHPSIKDWVLEKEKIKEEKKEEKAKKKKNEDDEENSTLVEDEAASKSYIKNPLNKAHLNCQRTPQSQLYAMEIPT